MSHKDSYSAVKITVPHGWTLDHDSMYVGPTGNDYAKDPDAPVLRRKGTFAGHCTDYENVHEIELRSNYNGSGESAFGGAKRWPTVVSKIKFNVNEYALAVEFSQALGEFIDDWMKVKSR